MSTTQLFPASEYAHLHSLVFRSDYPGYKPNVVESPAGDGVKDTEKRYAHVSEKYINTPQYLMRNPEEYVALNDYLDRAHDLAMQVAITIGVPREFWPVKKYSALRVLEYNAEATTTPHTDFDLFTLMCYRNLPQYFNKLERSDIGWDDAQKHLQRCYNSAVALENASQFNTQIHFGELLEEIDPNRYVATKHEVVASGGPWQYSVVYFAIPDHEAVLPSGVTVGKWLEERISRSRYER